MTPETLQGVTWTVARAGGMVAFVLLTASVAIGLALSLKWRSPRFTRWVTTEVHRFVTLLALVFIAVHGIALAVDPYIGFTLGELFVPLSSHYRPAWVALGITAGYVALAVYLSERIRGRIGYAWWHRFHLLAFVAWAGSLLHGLGAGSDSQSVWALALYAGSVAVVVLLMLLRLRPAPAPRTPVVAPKPAASMTPPARLVGPLAPSGPIAGPGRPAWAVDPSAPVDPDAPTTYAFVVPAGPPPAWLQPQPWVPPAPAVPAAVAGPASLRPSAAPGRPIPVRRRRSLRPLLALPVVAAVVAGSAWAATGPLAGDWKAQAGGVAAQIPDPSPSPEPTPSADPVTPIGLPFDVDLTGTVEQVDGTAPEIVVHATFTGDATGTLEFHIPMGRQRGDDGDGEGEGDDDEGAGRGGASATDAVLEFRVEPTGATCTGQLEYANEGMVGGSCTMPSGRQLAVAMRVGLDRSGGLVGVMEVSSAA